MKKVAIIGGSGFIGSNFIQCLNPKDYETFIFDIVAPPPGFDNSLFIHFDLRDPSCDINLLSGFDYIYILAALLGKKCKETPEDGWKTNIFGINNLIYGITAFKKKPVLVYTSSCMVYGDLIHTVPISENHSLNGKELYELSKIYAESLIASCCKAYGFTAIVLRFFTVFGDGPASAQKGHFIPTWIESAQKNGHITIFGDGKQSIDLTHVHDVSRALAILPQVKFGAGDFEIFNIATGKEISVNKIASFFKMAKPSLKINYEENKRNFPERKAGNIEKAKRMLGFEPVMDVEFEMNKLLKGKLLSE